MNKKLLPFLAVGVLVLAACGGDDEAVSVEQPWARATTAAQAHGAVYFELTVDHDDVLVGASVPSDIAATAEVHEVVEADESMDDMDHDHDDESMDDTDDMDHDHDDDHGGMAPGMIMREVADGVPLTADETVDFEPGGYHVMLLDLVEPLEVGEEFELTLELEENDDVTITVPVEETAP